MSEKIKRMFSRVFMGLRNGRKNATVKIKRFFLNKKLIRLINKEENALKLIKIPKFC